MWPCRMPCVVSAASCRRYCDDYCDRNYRQIGNSRQQRNAAKKRHNLIYRGSIIANDMLPIRLRPMLGMAIVSRSRHARRPGLRPSLDRPAEGAVSGGNSIPDFRAFQIIVVQLRFIISYIRHGRSARLLSGPPPLGTEGPCSIQIQPRNTSPGAAVRRNSGGPAVPSR